jgi:selenocysteine lyase/cysteine desulfurase
VQLATHRDTLVHAAREKLSVIDGIELTPLINDDGRAGIVSFRVHGMSSDEVGFVLDSVFSIQVRTGLHCAPAIHRALGTFPDGLVRASFGAFNGIDDVDAFADAIAHICQSKRG